MSNDTLVASRQFATFLRRWVALWVVCFLALPAHAALGDNLLMFVQNSIIAPLGIMAVVAALGASIFRPDLVRTAIYVAIICAVIFFILNSRAAVLAAFQS
jgi:hypothetical protein